MLLDREGEVFLGELGVLGLGEGIVLLLGVLIERGGQRDATLAGQRSQVLVERLVVGHHLLGEVEVLAGQVALDRQLRDLGDQQPALIALLDEFDVALFHGKSGRGHGRGIGGHDHGREGQRQDAGDS